MIKRDKKQHNILLARPEMLRRVYYQSTGGKKKYIEKLYFPAETTNQYKRY